MQNFMTPVQQISPECTETFLEKDLWIPFVKSEIIMRGTSLR